MKAAFVKTTNKIEIRDLSAPKLAPGATLLRIDGCGVCGSDYIEATAWAKKWKRFGHEIAATVERIGGEVQGFAPGDQVVLSLSAPCGECPQCLGGNQRGCTRLIVAEQGGFAEQLVVQDTRLMVKAPQHVAPELLVFAEPVSVLLDAFHSARVQPGDTVGVVGGGFLSCMGLLVAKAIGAKPVAVLSRSLHPGLESCLAAVGAELFQWNTLGGVTLSAPPEFGQKLATAEQSKFILHTPPPKYIMKFLDVVPFETTIVNIGLSGKTKDNMINIDASKLIFKRHQLMCAFPVPCLYMNESVQLLTDNKELFFILAPQVEPLQRLPEIIKASRRPKRKIMIAPNAI